MFRYIFSTEMMLLPLIGHNHCKAQNAIFTKQTGPLNIQCLQRIWKQKHSSFVIFERNYKISNKIFI